MVHIQPDNYRVCTDIDALRQELRSHMERCRSLTLDLFHHVDRATFCQQAHPDFSPIGWHLGHIGFTEAKWILQHCAGQKVLEPQYQRLFAADGLPKHERGNLPDLPEILTYLEQVRQQVFAYLEVAPLQEQERLWRFLLQHESQHCETIAIVLALLERVAQPATSLPSAGTVQQPAALSTALASTHEMVEIPAGEFCCGHASIEALDNERPEHRVYLERYWIDRYPVTCNQYQVFMAAGGYQSAQWWSPEGWEWLQTAQVHEPLYWQSDPQWGSHPVCGVSYYEAQAYARFVGKRLPTEMEWEKAARWHPATQNSQTYPWGEASPKPEFCNHAHLQGWTTPVDRFPAGQSPVGCFDLLGNVWEWTASWFDGYVGFESYPYTGYSQVYFDGQHRVLRGGSWATRSWAMRSAFRNWYYPHVRQIFAGFRCASDATNFGSVPNMRQCQRGSG